MLPLSLSLGDDTDSAELFHASDQDSCPPGSDNSAAGDMPCSGKTTAETSSKKRRLRMMDEDSDGVRIKIIPCAKEQFRRRMEATKVLEDGFYVPNRAQLMLDFLQKHGDRVVKETPGPKKRFRSTLELVQHVLHTDHKSSRIEYQDSHHADSPHMRGVCVCVHPDSKLRALVNTSDCKAGGRGTNTDSSANKAGLYVVRISLRTLSNAPACGNGNQAKPQTWQAEGQGLHEC